MGGRATRARASCLRVGERAQADSYLIDSLRRWFQRTASCAFRSAPGPRARCDRRIARSRRPRCGGRHLRHGPGPGRGELEPNPRPGVQLHVLLLDSEPAGDRFGLRLAGHGRGWTGSIVRTQGGGLLCGGDAEKLLVTPTSSCRAPRAASVTRWNRTGRESTSHSSVRAVLGRGLDADRLTISRSTTTPAWRERGYLDLGFQWRFGSGERGCGSCSATCSGTTERRKVGRELNFFYSGTSRAGTGVAGRPRLRGRADLLDCGRQVVA